MSPAPLATGNAKFRSGRPTAAKRAPKGPWQPAFKRSPSPPPCLVVELYNLPRYATKTTVTKAVAGLLHMQPMERQAYQQDGQDTNKETYSHVVGQVNFEVEVETLYSTAQNKGCATVTLPYEHLGKLIVANGVTVEGQLVKARPMLDKRVTDARLKQIRLTPYRDPAAIERLREKEENLRGHIALSSIEFGSLVRDGDQRHFYTEWVKDVEGENCVVDFERGGHLVRVSYGGHRDPTRRSIVVHRSSVRGLFKGTAWGMQYVVFHLTAPPVFESEPNACVPTGATKTSLTNIRDRLSALDDHHKLTAPFAFHLRICCRVRHGVQQGEGLGHFIHKALVAGLPAPSTIPLNDILNGPLYCQKSLALLNKWLAQVDLLVAFQIEALHRNLLIDTPTLLFDLRPEIDKIVKRHPPALTANILREFAGLIRAGRSPAVVLRGKQALQELLSKAQAQCLKASFLQPERGDHAFFDCHHVHITPTSIRLEGPFPVQSNRVVRDYVGVKYQHHLMRVHFTDEDRLQFRWDREVDGRSFVAEHVGGILKRGFDLCGRRHWDFLAYSFSALKEHTVWFLTPFNRPGEIVTAETLRRSLGDFEKVLSCPSLYGARLSQALSSTLPSIKLLQGELRRIPDVLGKDGHEVHCLTDGCAPCSKEIMDDIWRATGGVRSLDSVAPSAYQIRIGGSKGMIFVDPTLKGRVLCVRPSMHKFDAPHSLNIEIANMARISPMYLNRPLIMVLEDLGVPFKTFETLQNEAQRQAEHATTSLPEFVTLARGHNLGTRFRLPYLFNSLGDMGFALRNGGGWNDDNVLDDDFFQTIVKTALFHVLRDLKHHARIPVPNSWTLVGVSDETKLLGPNQIHVHIRDSEHVDGFWVTGKVMICRSPVVHPGDVQMVDAVIPPPGSPLAKEPLTNCVVFDTQGRRSLASCLGGGDLDGDLFHVSKYLSTSQYFKPSAYEPIEKKLLDRDSTINDVADFVIDYINSDILGLVATQHLIIADQSRFGIRDHSCLKLADLHSRAVDFPKAGWPVPISEVPKFLFPTKPDWKAGETGDDANGEYYLSTRAIGQLYRKIKIKNRDDIDLPKPRFDRAEVDGKITAALRGRIGTRNITPTASDSDSLSKTLLSYQYELRRICVLHSLHDTTPLTEEEVVVGTILATTSQPKKRKDLIARMKVHVEQVVGSVEKQLEVDDPHKAGISLRKAWQAWQLTVGKTMMLSSSEDRFGHRSFALIALSAICKALDTLESRSPDVEDSLPPTLIEEMNVDLD